MPFISGGDISGVIEEVGSSVSGWYKGDRVTLNPQTDEGMIGENWSEDWQKKSASPPKIS